MRLRSWNLLVLALASDLPACQSEEPVGPPTEAPTLSPASAAMTAAGPTIEFFNQSETQIDTIRPVRLWWKVTNATRVDVWDGFRNTVYPLLGNENYIEVWPERTATYRLTACNDQNVCSSREIIIQWAPLGIDYFLASTQVLNRPGPVQLRWKVRGSTRVDLIDGLTQTVNENVGREGVRDYYPNRSVTYTLVARAGDGTTQTQLLSVVVDRTDIAIIRDFNVYPPVLQFPGRVRVYWDVEYATNVEIVDGFSGRIYGQLPSRSMIQLFVGRSSIVGLRATGQNGEVIYREFTVTVVNDRF